MADEDLPPQEEAARKSNLAEQWQKLATWQKAGVIIAGGALAIGVLYYFNQQSGQASAAQQQGASSFPSANGAMTGFPGEEEMFPPVPVQPVTAPPTTTNTPAPPTTTTKPPDVTGHFIQQTQQYQQQKQTQQPQNNAALKAAVNSLSNRQFFETWHASGVPPTFVNQPDWRQNPILGSIRRM